MSDRFARHMPLFGAAGQEKIAATHVIVVGAGGVGSHVLQQLAYLGVSDFTIIEPEELDETNTNRLIGSRDADPVPGTSKVSIAERLLHSIDPSICVTHVQETLVSVAAYDAIKVTDVVFGCVDNEGTRLVLAELCSAYTVNYIDVASDVAPGDPPEWGGRVCISWNGAACLVCLEELDLQEARAQLAGPVAKEQRREIYGIDVEVLEGAGPSVVSVNGTIASLAVTEFMAAVTGLRPPIPLIRYRGWKAGITRRSEPLPDCYYCKLLRGQRGRADAERYIREGVGNYL